MTAVLTVLGCGGSAGVPRIGNDWGKCDPTEPRNARTRASVIVQNDQQAVLVDTGPDFRFQMNRENIKTVSAVLYTHVHADHVNGIDDLRSIRGHGTHKIPIYSSSDVIEYLKDRYDYMFRDIMPYYPAVLEPHIWGQNEFCSVMQVCGVPITVFEQDHQGSVSLGFRFGDVGYSTDMVNLNRQAIDALRGIRIWIADGNNFYSDDKGPHANKSRLEELNAQIGAETIYITHLKNNLDYQSLCRDLPHGFKPAFDGLQVKLDGTVLNDHAGK